MSESHYIDRELIARIEGFLAKNPEMTPTSFGRRAVNDCMLVADLKEGRELRRQTRERVLSFISSTPEKLS